MGLVQGAQFVDRDMGLGSHGGVTWLCLRFQREGLMEQCPEFLEGVADLGSAAGAVSLTLVAGWHPPMVPQGLYGDVL